MKFPYFMNWRWFRKPAYGVIYLTIEAGAYEEINFHVNAKVVEVEWGDASRSGEKGEAVFFRHVYVRPGIYQIIVSGKDIIDLDLRQSQLLKLNLDYCPSVEFIDCSDNQLTELDVRNCKRLYELHCSHNQLSSLKLGRYRKLFHLSCAWNKLDSLDLGGCPKLVNLVCEYNNIRTIDIGKCRRLHSVNIGNNKLDLSALKYFVASLALHPQAAKGYVVLRNNGTNNLDRNWVSRRGWYEI